MPFGRTAEQDLVCFQKEFGRRRKNSGVRRCSCLLDETFYLCHSVGHRIGAPGRPWGFAFSRGGGVAGNKSIPKSVSNWLGGVWVGRIGADQNVPAASQPRVHAARKSLSCLLSFVLASPRCEICESAGPTPATHRTMEAFTAAASGSKIV